jgi:hypothetical protein
MILKRVVVVGTIANVPAGTLEDPNIVTLFNDVEIRYVTEDEGVHAFLLKKGFKYNQRSGGFFVDVFIPHQGSYNMATCWCGHDAGAYPNTPSLEIINELLRQALILHAGVSPELAQGVESMVTLANKVSPWKAEEWADVEPLYQCNLGKVTYRWTA